jgi:hypothetical protein
MVDAAGTVWVCIAGGELVDVPVWKDISGGGFTPISPVRIYDTREGKAPVSNGDNPLVSEQEVILDGRTGFAGASNLATGLVLNLTAESATSIGFISLYPASDSHSLANLPTTSNLNYKADGSTVANAATVGLALSGPDAGRFKVFNFGPNTTVELLIDVVGYYT